MLKLPIPYPHTIFQQVFSFILLRMISLQPEAVRRSYWARHWACAIDVMELLAAEAAFTHSVDGLIAGGEPLKGIMDSMNVKLKDFVLKLMGDQYRPGEQ